MTGILGPDDLGRLALTLCSLKYLNLNLGITEVLGPDIKNHCYHEVQLLRIIVIMRHNWGSIIFEDAYVTFAL